MSWVRWGKDSSLYIYEDINGGITCCDCSLSKKRRFNCRTKWAMRRHIKKHKKAGDLVPAWLLRKRRHHADNRE